MADQDGSAVPDYMSLMRQDGNGAVIIGAGNGIGRQVARALAAVGANVFCVDVIQERAAAVAAETGGVAWSGNVTSQSEVARLFDQAQAQLGSIQVVVDVVGLGQQHLIPLVEMNDDLWDATFDINFRQCRYVVQEGGRALLASGGGAMVFVSSMVALTAAPRISAYGAAKAALISLVKSAAAELGPQIRVNCIAPGPTLTPRLSSQMNAEERAAHSALYPLGRLAEPYEQAGVILFLTSTLASFVTGQTLLVDGGLLLNPPGPGLRWPGESAYPALQIK